MAKKLYLHELATDTKDGKRLTGIQHKHKGISKSGMEHAAYERNENLAVGIKMIYEEMAAGEVVPILQNPPGAVVFQYNAKRGSVNTVLSSENPIFRRVRSAKAIKRKAAIQECEDAYTAMEEEDFEFSSPPPPKKVKLLLEDDLLA